MASLVPDEPPSATASAVVVINHHTNADRTFSHSTAGK